MAASLPHRVSYALWGSALAVGSPLGFLLLRLGLRGERIDLDAVHRELEQHLPEYLYLTLSTTAVMLLLGWLLGRKEDAVETRSLTDALTGLANRRLLLQRLDGEVARARRYEAPLALLLVDLDRLKQINDREGHAGGDRALRLVAAALEGTCRETDLPARIGGDEFAVLAPGTRAGQARELGLRLLGDLRARVAGGELPDLTISVGVADSKTLTELSAEGLLSAADGALYEAKLSGRNRMRVASHPSHAVDHRDQNCGPIESF